jgi:hypothetical protein
LDHIAARTKIEQLDLLIHRLDIWRQASTNGKRPSYGLSSVAAATSVAPRQESTMSELQRKYNQSQKAHDAIEATDPLDALQTLDLAGLRDRWEQRYGPPPKLRSVELLRLMLAWRIQADTFGGLDKETRKILKRRGPVKAEGLELGVGAILRRQWQGRVVEVIVEEDGFRWNDQTFKSLSAAATVIAGTKWNGPRFFGLRRPRP